MKINYTKGSEVSYPVRFSLNPDFNPCRFGIYPYTRYNVESEHELLKIIRDANSYYESSAKDIFIIRFLSGIHSSVFVIDDNGFVVNPDYLFNKAFLLKKYKEKKCIITVGYKRKYCSGMRNPRTLNELRESCFAYSCDEYSEPKARGRRTKSYIPTSWDDIWRRNDKNWKKNRLKQYHVLD